MSAKLGAMSTRKPKSSKAQGACSRLEPQPKLRRANRMLAPVSFGWFNSNSGFGEPSSMKSPIEEQILAEAGPLDPLQKLLGNDLIGIDVGPVHRGDQAGVFGEGLHGRSLRLEAEG